jgi:hypothetical protein
LQAIEIKSGTTFAPDWAAACRKWRQFAGDEALTPIVVYGGNRTEDLGDCRLLGWQHLAAA